MFTYLCPKNPKLIRPTSYPKNSPVCVTDVCIVVIVWRSDGKTTVIIKGGNRK